MGRNVYFSQQVKSEQWLFEDLTIEALRIYGQEVYYLPRKILTRDMILNEDRESAFDDAFMCEMYIENVEGFEGEGNLMQKFGLEIRDEATFIVARRTWEKLVGVWNNNITGRPNEGDLIYLPLSGNFFEISFVEHEQPFYQLNNLPVYKLQCRTYEYSSEDFETGIAEIDQIETEFGNITKMAISDVTGNIEIGTRLYQVLRRDENGLATQWISGEVVDQEAVTGTSRNLYLTDIETNTTDAREFYESTASDLTTYLVDDVNLANPPILAQITNIFDLTDDQDGTFANDDAAQNYDFEKTADDFIDFSEQNPFGEPGVAPVIAQRVIYRLDSTLNTSTLDSTTVTIDNT